MASSHSLTCISHLWDQLVSAFTIPKKIVRVLPLPDDLIVEILSRLPADEVLKCQRVCRKLRALTSTTNFAEKHAGRATPIIFLQYFPFLCHTKSDLFFLDEGTKKHMMIKKKSANGILPTNIGLIGSCNGLLLFGTSLPASDIYILNPVTQEQLKLTTPFLGCYICGIFFHKLTKEYRVLIFHGEANCFHYQIRSLGGKSWRQVGTFAYGPEEGIAPIIMNGALHWMAGDDINDFIMIFNMDTEEFQAMPPPVNDYLCLIEIEGQLSLCCQYDELIDIWVLEEYANWVWVKRYRVSLRWGLKRYPFKSSWLNNDDIIPMAVRGGELLLFWAYRGIFQYHLQLHTVRKVNSKGMKKAKDIPHYIFRFTTYTNSFVSLRELTTNKELK